MKNEADREDEINQQPDTQELCEPSLYQVVLHNDNYTPIEFVMGILEKYFYFDRREAAVKTLEAHAKGQTICGIFSRDFAEAKVAQVIEFADVHDHPLHCSMEVA
jgi:ATP-dependent Clp protease adaptor protein ClpS